MKIIDHYRSSIRVTQDIEDTSMLVCSSFYNGNGENIIDNQAMTEACKDLPVIYIVKAQVKVLFLWVTIWRESCDISDEAARICILGRANDLFKMLDGTP